MFSVMTSTDMIDRKQPLCCIREKKIIAPYNQSRVADTEDLSESLHGPRNICVLLSPPAKKEKDEVTFLQGSGEWLGVC